MLKNHPKSRILNSGKYFVFIRGDTDGGRGQGGIKHGNFIATLLKLVKKLQLLKYTYISAIPYYNPGNTSGPYSILKFVPIFPF